MEEKDDSWGAFFKTNPSYAIFLFLLVLLAFSLAPFEPSICTGDDQNPCKYVVRYHLIHWLFAFVDKYSGAISALATIAIAVYTVVLARVSNRQAKLIKESIDEAVKATDQAKIAASAAIESNELSRNAMIAEQRPWVSIEIGLAGPLTWSDTGADFVFQFDLQNLGQSPALNVFVDIEIHGFFGSNGIELQRNLSTRLRNRPFMVLGINLFPGKDARFQNRISIGPEAIEAITNRWASEFNTNSSWISPLLVGCVSYFSVFDSRHETGFIRQIRLISAINGSLAISPESGDIPVSNLQVVRGLQDGIIT
jgi:hypothetical protein